MCGIAAIAGESWTIAELDAMTRAQQHRGPDNRGLWMRSDGKVGLGHNRLSVIDLSAAANQPMTNLRQDLQIAFNGEIYNYQELRETLSDYPYCSKTDTEVVLAAYEKWGEACLDRFVGMFAFVLWDERRQTLFAARDRFGVKPLYYSFDGQCLRLASEIRALHASGVEPDPNDRTWATYLTYGMYDHGPRTFWRNIVSLPAGHQLVWRAGTLIERQWYDLAARVGPDCDDRPIAVVQEEYLELLRESMRFRFRSDVPVGINLSGGLDSSIALGLVDGVGGKENTMVFSYVTGDPAYDELPWVEKMLNHSQHPLTVSPLNPRDVPALAASVQSHESEPFGGLPTLAYARLFEIARAAGVIVLLDGQGLDEQWAGYDYYETPAAGNTTGPVQGSKRAAVLPECLVAPFRQLAEPLIPPKPFPDPLRNRQYLDVRHTKIPRALRFNDRVSARSSTELREPFMDHRLFEVAFRQPADRKIRGGVRKWLLRQIARQVVPASISEAPKRPVQTPQREWLLGPLQGWTLDCIGQALDYAGDTWLDRREVTNACERYLVAGIDNSFYLWQWISLGLMARDLRSLRTLSRTMRGDPGQLAIAATPPKPAARDYQ